MAPKKKSKKKSPTVKKSAGRKSTPAKKLARKRTSSKKSTSKKSAKRTVAPKKATPKKQSRKQTSGGKATKVAGRPRNKGPKRSPSAFRETTGSRWDEQSSGVQSSGEQSGDLQGLSDVEGADSESVDELLEEGNAFEAGVVSGVESAGEREGREVHTREVPEDDVPGEYLDED